MTAGLRVRALHYLRQALGNSQADFRDGQWEAIEALVECRARLLVVQRTGWGKSIVYFLTTRLLREFGAGLTLLVSPLLALMRNQLEAARRIGVRPATINSSMELNEQREIERQLRGDAVDVLLISPERFANQQFQEDVLIPLAQKTGLFVVDEAHCISDWGHDFRPDYRRIVRVLKHLPENVPICATTATANDRVVDDVVSQLGAGLQVSRGPLVRDSLRLQTVPLSDDGAKLAWLAHYLPKFEGSGVVYALTVRWTERIATWLQGRGINAESYSAQLPDEERRARETRLQTNAIKVLVATTALGMGYDKPDLGFVIHFHQPASVVHYYQQVGRAGRAIERSYGVMLSGGDDRDIIDYFIEEAFPPEEEITMILNALERSAEGLAMSELEAEVNLSRSRIERVLKTLAVENPAPVAQLERRWVATPQRYDPERRRLLVGHLTSLRRREQAQMDSYRQHTGCLMEFLAGALDDPAAGPCGKCAPCRGKPEALRDVPEPLVREAIAFLKRSNIPIEPRARWQSDAFPTYGWNGPIAAELRAEPGRALCVLGDGGWGSLVRRGKYQDGKFSDELVEALAGVVRGWRPLPTPTWVTCVPSLTQPVLVQDLATRLASRLALPFVPVAVKVKPTSAQKGMANSWHQAHNLDGAFRINAWARLGDSLLLVDDIFDSRWTFTVLAALLRQAGSGPVFPLALAANR
jgi:ATP-dependent DNA helicase RecQ